MFIVIRTRHFNTFIVGFKSFICHYESYLKYLVVQVQSSGNEIEHKMFEAASKEYGFKLIFIDYSNVIGENCFAYMIWKSLQYDEVVSLDDDIVYMRPGFFDALLKVTKQVDKQILGFKYQILNKYILNSAILYVKNCVINKADFEGNIQKIFNNFEGVDTGPLSEKFNNNIGFIDQYFNRQVIGYKNTILTDYTYHIGGVSCMHNIIHNKAYL